MKENANPTIYPVERKKRVRASLICFCVGPARSVDGWNPRDLSGLFCC